MTYLSVIAAAGAAAQVAASAQADVVTAQVSAKQRFRPLKADKVVERPTTN